MSVKKFINKCPICGGNICISMEVPTSFLLGNDETGLWAIQKETALDMLNNLRRNLQEKTPYKCYCENCKTALTVTPIQGVPEQFLIQENKKSK